MLKDSSEKQIANYFCCVNELNALLNAQKCKFLRLKETLGWFDAWLVGWLVSWLAGSFICSIFVLTYSSGICQKKKRKIYYKYWIVSRAILFHGCNRKVVCSMLLFRPKDICIMFGFVPPYLWKFWSRVSPLIQMYSCVCVFVFLCVSAKSAGMLCVHHHWYFDGFSQVNYM